MLGQLRKFWKFKIVLSFEQQINGTYFTQNVSQKTFQRCQPLQPSAHICASLVVKQPKKLPMSVCLFSCASLL